MNACSASAARVALGTERAAAELDDGDRAARENVERRLLLELAELRLAARLEQLGDGRAGSLLDDRVDRDELPPESLGELRAERRLPRAHEAHERDVTA